MGFGDTSNTRLQLGLALSFHDHESEDCMKKTMENQPKCKKPYPKLTLGPPDEDEAKNQPTASKTEESFEYLHPQFPSPSTESSFSNSSSIKRERDQVLGGEEFELEVEKVPTRVVDVDEDGNTRKKLRLTKEQSALLEENFREHSTLNPKQKHELAKKLNLRARQVEVWFQNRRARTKLKQTESDRELLKKCCETLTQENKKLQKELLELKSSPFYMQIPAATLTICPSCERVCGGNNNGSSPTTTLLIGSKGHHQFYNNIHHPQHVS